jgi:hypothetical protein
MVDGQHCCEVYLSINFALQRLEINDHQCDPAEVMAGENSDELIMRVPDREFVFRARTEKERGIWLETIQNLNLMRE